MSLGEFLGVGLGLIGAVASVWFLWERFLARKKLTWRFTEKTVSRFAKEMAAKGFSPTLIIGIGRGGAVMGALLSGVLGHRPLIVIDRKYAWQDGRRIDGMLMHTNLPPSLLERVLLVAGEVHTGNTMRLYCEYFRKLGAKSIARAALFVQKGATEPVEYIGRESETDCQLPWMFTKEYCRGSVSEAEAKALDSLHT